jgi:integrase
MQLREFPERDDAKAVWLSADEITQLLDTAKTDTRRWALGIMARCGLRVDEAAQIKPIDLIESDAGRMCRIRNGKGGKTRETPVPAELFYSGRALGNRDDRNTVVGVKKRTIQSWVRKTADELYEQTEKVAWSFVSAHDLRRSWGTLLVQNDVEPLLVMEWGGWENYETFKEHYMSIHDPEFQRDEQNKVSWL